MRLFVFGGLEYEYMNIQYNQEMVEMEEEEEAEEKGNISSSSSSSISMIGNL